MLKFKRKTLICDLLNEAIRCKKFPAIFKNRSIIVAFKKGFKKSKENYRPVSIFPIISKNFEKRIRKILQSLWSHCYENNNVVFEVVLVDKIVYWQL